MLAATNSSSGVQLNRWDLTLAIIYTLAAIKAWSILTMLFIPCELLSEFWKSYWGILKIKTHNLKCEKSKTFSLSVAFFSTCTGANTENSFKIPNSAYRAEIVHGTGVVSDPDLLFGPPVGESWKNSRCRSTLGNISDAFLQLVQSEACRGSKEPNMIYVGMGEHAPRGMTSYGDGVYKSTDAGKTGKN